MPLTLRRSSALANGSFARCSTIACAFDGPMPGSVASSADDAVLRLTLPSGADSTAAALTPRSRSPQRSPATAFLNRLILASSLAPLRAPYGRRDWQAAFHPRWARNCSARRAGATFAAAGAATLRLAVSAPAFLSRAPVLLPRAARRQTIARGVAQPG